VRARFDLLQLPWRFVDLRSDIVAIWSKWNEADDGRLVLPQEYLLSVI
jgi:hypothetical protein